MNNTFRRLSLTSAALAATLITISTGSAHAIGVTAYADCTTTGANGAGTFASWTNNHANVGMTTTDTSADGHHTAVRMISMDANDKISYWSWHHNYEGSGKTISVDTSASTGSGGLSYIGVQIAVMEGSTIIRSCRDWAS